LVIIKAEFCAHTAPPVTRLEILPNPLS